METARKAKFFYSRSNFTGKIKNIRKKRKKKISEETFR